MRAYIARLHQELGTTTLYVTHDQTEAMTMGDRVAVMRDGRLEQVDSPQRLYEQPANMFVAGFIGSPAMNLLRGRVDDDGVWLGDQRLRRADDVSAATSWSASGPRRSRPRPDDGDVLEMPVVLSEMLGSDVLLHLDAPTSSALTADMLDTGEDLVDDGVPLHRPRAAGRAARAGRAGAAARGPGPRAPLRPLDRARHPSLSSDEGAGP